MSSVQQRKERVAMLSVASNSTLVVFKVIVGILIGSVSIISEAIHSGMDLLAAIIAMFSVKKSHLPADDVHPFGHGKVESISGLIEAVLIFIAAFWIIFEAFKKLTSMQEVESPGWGVAVMLLSAVLNFFVSQRLFAVGRETDSIALTADAWHLRTDVFTSAGVMVSLGIIWVSHFFFEDPRIHWLDPVAAIFVAVFILKAAYDLTAQALGDLMDVKLPLDEEDWIRSVIVGHRPEIHGYHQLRTRKAGNFRFIEFHIKVDPRMTVETSHGITRDLKFQIMEKISNSTVTIHIEPCDGNCTEVCLSGCLLPEDQRKRLSMVDTGRDH
ncbi:MAG: Ferrous-iron efflux pump FieF [Deltaproteobacteria bacterium ADurb.Bin151]|nr:MAG: Ferrous-iron efflux pump FieF [Deltaproteobacteria bacterium ADurb.Bin151]HNZ10633.1 cation diffusion facilitator family transporter [Smithellaceae bacterium]HOG81185.1 cation diffusion facilitator family transporter [Smithellaceae bacterium]HOQ40626.1 cation diffusion facilitator family transporter [Smithellaceae bacterium]HPL64876.1 cation diffusion facilitator family transporter [Smithellaceae bacterium]